MVKLFLIVTGCLRGGIKQFKEDIRDLFIEKKRFKTVNEMLLPLLLKAITPPQSANTALYYILP